MNECHDELNDLLLQWESGVLDEKGVERVRSILRDDPAARRRYAQFQMLSAALHGLGESRLPIATGGVASIPNAEHTLANSEPRRRPRRLYGWTRVIAAVAAMIVFALLGRWVHLEFIEPTTDARRIAKVREPTSRGIALLTQLIDVDFGQDAKPLSVGQALEVGTFAIDSGLAQIEFFSGATIVLEGPAEIELASSSSARMRRGRLRAHVPPAARGFSIETSDLQLIDLGTEFGLSVDSEGADVQVFDGEVELREPGSSPRRLTTGQAVSQNNFGDIVKTDVQPQRFTSLRGLQSRTNRRQTERYEIWKQHSAELRRDPRLITYYAFDQRDVWDRRLACSLEPDNHELDGAIVGADRAAGRFPGKGALEFKQPADRVRIQIPGEYGSLTFVAWVKIDSLDRWYNSLFLTDNYNQGEPHWQILDTGRLFFSVRVMSDDGSGPEHREVLSPSFWSPAMSGKWLHLATTYDVDDKQVTHFLNGRVLHRESIPDHQLVRTTRFGPSTIGNWSSPQRPDRDFAIRNLNGSLDEFAVFSASLSVAEIQDIFEHGKP